MTIVDPEAARDARRADANGEVEAQEDPPRVAQYHHEAYQSVLHAADPNRAEVGPVDLSLLAWNALESQGGDVRNLSIRHSRDHRRRHARSSNPFARGYFLSQDASFLLRHYWARARSSRSESVACPPTALHGPQLLQRNPPSNTTSWLIPNRIRLTLGHAETRGHTASSEDEHQGRTGET